MAQKAQVIDVTKSYIPGDPNAFPENLVSTDTEDKEEKTNPVNFYEGYNFLPTSYGYRSFFGTTARLNIPAVPSRVQFVLSYQSDEYVNNLIALCEDGIWIIDPTLSTNEWKHIVVHTFDVSIFEEWTWCVIENSVYMYKQGGANVYHTSNIDDAVNNLNISIITTTPTFLNMSGQMGIFKAGTRLGFWDSANSVAWSSNLDLNDFTPSLENLAGNTIFGYVVGRITHVRDHGEGFIVYSTKSIVGVAFSSESNLLWDAHNISNTTGVALGREVTQGINNSEHIVNATAGLHRIGSYNGLTKVHEFSPIAVEISDVIKESRDPVFLDVIEGRYLYLHIINSDYINGKISFETIDIPSMELDGIPYPESTTIPPSLLVKMIQKLERDTTDEVYGETLTKYVEDGTPFDIIEWEASYRMSSTLGLAEKYITPSLGANFKYGDAGTLDRSSLGWDNRTPTGSIFVPIGGDYNSLDMGLPLFSYEDLQNRTTESASNFSTIVSKILRFQTDAFTHEDNKGTYSLAYQTQQAVDTIPSHLDITSRTSLGLLEGMYNVESIWKDYEKRQDSSIARFTEIIKDLKPFSWKANSIYGNLESTIETPIYELFDLYKPYGNVGITALEGSKGFFFYKQYRDYYDCILAATRNVTAINEYSTIGNGICEAPIPVNYFDAIDIVPSINGVVTRISLTAHRDNYLQDLISESLANGIYLNGFNRLMEFVPLEEQGIVLPWKMSGAITLGVRDFGGSLTTYWCECIPRQYVQLDSEWKEPNVITEASISTVVAPGGGASGFPNPNNYPLVFTAVSGGSWPWIGDSSSVFIRYAIVRDSDNKISEYSTVQSVYISTSDRMKVEATIDLPAGYSFLIRFDAISSPIDISNKGVFTSITVGDPIYVNDISALSSIGTLDIFTTGNTYVVPGLTGLSFSVASSYGSYPSRVEKIWAMPVKNGKTGPLVLIRDVITTQGHTFNIAVTPSEDHSGYILIYYTVDSAQPPYYYLTATNQTSYSFGDHYADALLTTSTPINIYQTALTFAPYVEGTPGEVTINQTFEGTYYKVQAESETIQSEYPYLIQGGGFGGSAAFHNPNDYPLTIAEVTGGAWEASTSFVGVYYAIYDKSTGEVSDRKALSLYSISANGRLRISITKEPPSGCGYRLYLAPSHKTYNIYYINSDFTVGSYSYINSLASFTNTLTSFPDANVVTSGNTYEVAVESADYTITINPEGSPAWIVDSIIYLSFIYGPTTSLGTLGILRTDSITFQNTSSKGIRFTLLYTIAGTDYLEGITVNPGASLHIDSSDGSFGYATLIPNPNFIPLAFATNTAPIPGQLLGYHQSINQSITQAAGYYRNLEMLGQWRTNKVDNTIYRGSSNISDYYTESAEGYVKLYSKIFTPGVGDSNQVVLILRQEHGFIYIYEVEEEPLGSIIPSLSVDLGGANTEPTLDTEGVFNTIGAFFTPKNKVSATLSNGVLTKGVSVGIATYPAVEAEILDYLVPSDSSFLTNKYLLPPTYDEGESWYYVKDADTIYRSCTIFEHKTGTVTSLETPLWSTDLYLENFMPLDIPLETTIVISESLGILPGAQFLIQDGTPAPSYPTFTGAFVYDLFLKKWGKMKEDYKVVFSYSPVNSNTGGNIDYTNFGMDAGVVLSDNFISIFDKEPVDSWIRLGKLGYYRLGNTTALEAKAMFRANSSGSITIDSSLDGRTLFVPVRYKKTYKNVVSVTGHPSMSGRWHTIKIEGNYDLQYLEFRGIISGRR